MTMTAKDRILRLLYLVGDRGINSDEIGLITKTGIGKLYWILHELEKSGQVRSEFLEGKKHRKRRYWLVNQESFP